MATKTGKSKSTAAKKSAGKQLVIVESPTKARTMKRFLGSGYEIKASMGHVRDLPKKSLAIDVEKNFTPQYEIVRQDVIKDIKQSFNSNTAVYLATDPDREGEAISWHILECAGLKKANSVQRVVFHEITPNAVAEAFNNPRTINMDLVNAQQARRLLDRLVGYKVSAVLWQKVRRGLSAGRVQSVALSLIVQREREIEDFKPQEYWNIHAHFLQDSEHFRAKLTLPGKKRVDNGKDATKIKGELEKSRFTVEKVAAKTVKQRPAPPFTTSTLQQEASRRFGMNGRDIMRIAQQLYEGVNLGSAGSTGLITYMRTDSTHLAETAIKEAAKFITDKYGKDYGGTARRYKTKSASAQEAHEAIRPTKIHQTPAAVEPFLKAAQMKLYKLIWNRTVGSQMKDAILEETTADIKAETDKSTHLLRASGLVLKFDGFRKLYMEHQRETSQNSDDDDATNKKLPPLKEGMVLTLDKKGIAADQKFTQPPPRLREDMLIHAMEQHGIGRPSTYASIIHTIEQREYVIREEKRFKPTVLGKAVCAFLEKNFANIMDIKFTAGMEADLDAIARGEADWVKVLSRFYEPFSEKIASAKQFERVNAAELAEPSDVVCEECGKPMVIKKGRYGKFLSCSDYPDCKNMQSLKQNNHVTEETDEACEKCERPMVIKSGRYGRFLSCSGFPDCKNIRPLVEYTDVTCPRCNEGQLIKRESRRGPFFGCSKYPECRFALNYEPVKEPCPKCGSLVYKSKDGKRLICYSKDCDWKDKVPN